jgi:hypothetical protein
MTESGANWVNRLSCGHVNMGQFAGYPIRGSTSCTST